MPRKKKHPMEMTNEEAMAKLFHPRVVKHVKKIAQEAVEKAEKRTRRVPTNEV